MQQPQPQRRQRAFGDLLPRSPEDLPRVYAWFEQMNESMKSLGMVQTHLTLSIPGSFYKYQEVVLPS